MQVTITLAQAIATVLAAGYTKSGDGILTPPAATGSSASPIGTVVEAGESSTITDNAGNIWGINAAAQVTVNGAADPTTAEVTAIGWDGTLVWQENADGGYWSKTAPTAAWIAGTPPAALVGMGGTQTPPPPSGGTAPLNVMVTGQGDGSASLAWTAPSPAPASYKVYRNGAKIASVTATSYNDGDAPNTLYAGFNGAASPYAYSVTAVTAGVESAQAQASVWMYKGGTVNNIGGDYSVTVANYSDTSGDPQPGSATDISLTCNGAADYWQPWVGPPKPFPQWNLEVGGFAHMTIDLKPTIANQTWNLAINSRGPNGDIYGMVAEQVILGGSDATYGPEAVPGKWATYKIPLARLAMGSSTVIGSVSGNTLNVTQAPEAPFSVEEMDWVSGPGIPEGIYITAASGTGGTGSYTLSGSATVPAGTEITLQRTQMYKPWLRDNSGSGSNLYYVDNLGFTP
jgi:hypothetical protein